MALHQVDNWQVLQDDSRTALEAIKPGLITLVTVKPSLIIFGDRRLVDNQLWLLETVLARGQWDTSALIIQCNGKPEKV